jgi:hypothetical protein
MRHEMNPTMTGTGQVTYGRLSGANTLMTGSVLGSFERTPPSQPGYSGYRHQVRGAHRPRLGGAERRPNLGRLRARRQLEPGERVNMAALAGAAASKRAACFQHVTSTNVLPKR